MKGWPGSFINNCWIGLRWSSIVGRCAWAKARIPNQGGRWLPRRQWLLSLCACRWGRLFRATAFGHPHTFGSFF